MGTTVEIKPEEHLGLVCKVVSKYVPRGIPVEDTEEYADGVVALLGAAKSYDPEKHTEFSTYAYIAIKNALIRKWNRQKCKKRDAVVSSLDDQVIVAPVDTGNYEFLKLIFKEHPNDTEIDVRNKKILFDYYINDMTLQEIGDQMHSRYGQKKPVTKVCVKLYIDAAIKLIRKRFNLDDFLRIEEILS